MFTKERNHKKEPIKWPRVEELNQLNENAIENICNRIEQMKDRVNKLEDRDL